MKKVFSWMIIGILLVGGLNTGLSGVVAVAAQAGVIRFAPRQIREANRRKRYTVTAKYPQALAAGSPKIEQLNLAIKRMIEDQVNGFKKDLGTPEGSSRMPGNSFSTSYTVEYATPDLVSIDFGVSTYFEGAAHGNYNSLPFNYWFETGKTLTLADLFKPNSNYLSAISAYSIKALRRTLGPEIDNDWIENGAGAKDENYQNWNITRRGLKITFDPYQVASYAQGPQEVIIPYAALKSLIDPAGPLGKVAK